MAKAMISWQAFPSFPSSSRASRVSLAPKTSFPFPFKLLPRGLENLVTYGSENFGNHVTVRPPVRPSARPTDRPSVRPHRHTNGNHSINKQACNLSQYRRKRKTEIVFVTVLSKGEKPPAVNPLRFAANSIPDCPTECQPASGWQIPSGYKLQSNPYCRTVGCIAA